MGGKGAGYSVQGVSTADLQYVKDGRSTSNGGMASRSLNVDCRWLDLYAATAELGEGYVRFALVEPEHRLKDAIERIKRVLEMED